MWSKADSQLYVQPCDLVNLYVTRAVPPVRLEHLGTSRCSGGLDRYYQIGGDYHGIGGGATSTRKLLVLLALPQPTVMLQR